jgi:HEAT repeat protein
MKGTSREVTQGILRVHRLRVDRNVPGLIQELDNPLERGRYKIVRSHAANALGRLGDPRAIPHLMRLLADDPHDHVRIIAAGSLGWLNAEEAIPLLVKRLDDPSVGPRSAAAEALGMLKADAAAERLAELLLDEGEDDEVRWSAGRALVRMGRGEGFKNMFAQHLAGVPWWRRWRRERWTKLVSNEA